MERLGQVEEEEFSRLGFGYRRSFYTKTCEILLGKIKKRVKDESGKVVISSPLEVEDVPSPLGRDLKPTKECLREIRMKGKKKKKKENDDEKAEDGDDEQGEPTVDEVSLGLQMLTGVGQKVADCIGKNMCGRSNLRHQPARHPNTLSPSFAALFSLGCHDIVPCDTHVFQMAARWDDELKEIERKAKEKGKGISMTKKINKRVREAFRSRFPGGYAGWAQAVLFCLELPSFKAGEVGKEDEKDYGEEVVKEEKTTFHLDDSDMPFVKPGSMPDDFLRGPEDVDGALFEQAAGDD